jgi:hypothetical protein
MLNFQVKKSGVAGAQQGIFARRTVQPNTILGRRLCHQMKNVNSFICTSMLSIQGNNFIAPRANEEIVLMLAEHTTK